MTGLEERDASHDSIYWASYMNVIPESKQHLWSALLDGLEKYSEILGARSTLINDTNALQQQNAELRMLLHQYVNSRVSFEAISVETIKACSLFSINFLTSQNAPQLISKVLL